MEKKDIYKTDFLFPNPSFLIGIGSIANFFGSYFEYNSSSSEKEADAKAILSDWGVSGLDIFNAINKIDSELSLKKVA